MSTGSFADRFVLILKALSMSRGRLASELGFDKSLVGRWASGSVRPSANSLERLTKWVATQRPGFTLLDWEHDLPQLAERFGVVAPPPNAPPVPKDFEAFLPASMAAEVAATTKLRGWAYAGMWRTTRPSAHLPGSFVHDHIWLRPSADGLMQFTMGVFTLRLTGTALLMRNQLFCIASDAGSGMMVFCILNGIPRLRADALDGLTLTCLGDSVGTPVAATVLLERVGSSSIDEAANAAAFDALCRQHPVANAEDIAPDIRAHLWRDVGPTPFALGGDPVLIMHVAQSLSRGPMFIPEGAQASTG